jgi:WD40 repeat protein
MTVPAGLELVATLRGHTGEIRRLAWSPTGLELATPSGDGTVRIWDAGAGQLLSTLDWHTETVHAVAWSPDGALLASGGVDGPVMVWAADGAHVDQMSSTGSWVNCLAWSPDGQLLAIGYESGEIRAWEVHRSRIAWREAAGAAVNALSWAQDGSRLAAALMNGTIALWTPLGGYSTRLRGHASAAFTVDWNARFLASGGWDDTVRMWDVDSLRETATFEGPVGRVSSVSFSADGRLLAVKGIDDGVVIYDLDDPGPGAALDEPASGRNSPSLAFHPHLPYLATLGDRDRSVRIWRVDIEALTAGLASKDHVRYRNAKVVLLGDTGTGKTGLALALTGQPWVPTESTTGRRVSTLGLHSTDDERHELLLWDTAGQPGYRLIHQLHLDEVSVALVVFDARSETDPFAGVRHWRRALAQVQHLRAAISPPMQVLLVAARSDVEGSGVSRQRIDEVVRDLGFAGFHETSAKEGWGVDELGAAVRAAVDWDALPVISSTRLFEAARAFVEDRRRAGRVLASAIDLYYDFNVADPDHRDEPDLRAKFDTCLGLMENHRIIRRLSFGGQVLLRPELLDGYASAIVSAARDEPDGLGSLPEGRIRNAEFRLPSDERLSDPHQERLLLSATAEELLRYEIAFRVGTDLVFPAGSTRRPPDPLDLPRVSVTVSFLGPVRSIYTTLAVRLSRSEVFTNDEMWENAARFGAVAGGSCGLVLRELEGGRAELGLFFGRDAAGATRRLFEVFVENHLRRWALPGSVSTERRVVCVNPACAEPFADDIVRFRRGKGSTAITCPRCDTVTPLSEPAAPVPEPSEIGGMDAAADAGRDRDTALAVVAGKRTAGQYDLFISYNSVDRSEVDDLVHSLEERGIRPFLDHRDLGAGASWQDEVLRRLPDFPAAAVLIGDQGVGPWQHQEIQVLTDLSAKGACRVVPVWLRSPGPGAVAPGFLINLTWIDYGKKYPDPLTRLVTAVQEAVGLPW